MRRLKFNARVHVATMCDMF